MNLTIIEVKFFVQGALFVIPQKSKYTTSRFKDGYEQLNKYCEHLSENYTMHSAYLYMFYASNMEAKQVEADDKRYYKEFISGNECNESFHRHYKKTIYDNMLDSVF